jgi:porphyrinogen peroxidase
LIGRWSQITDAEATGQRRKMQQNSTTARELHPVTIPTPAALGQGKVKWSPVRPLWRRVASSELPSGDGKLVSELSRTMRARDFEKRSYKTRHSMKSDPISAPDTTGKSPALAQAVAAPLTRAAIFLVATVNPGSENRAALRSFCGDLAALVRAVEFRDLEGGLSCIMGFGSEAWDRLFGVPRPAELHSFREFRAGGRHAVSTTGDLLFHIRAKRMDLSFELATQIMARIGDAISPVDEVQGFRYFDDRDLMGFVDGTENPRGEAAANAVLIGDEDPNFANGSYVIVQKYLHNLDAWNALPTEAQERIIGRTKLSDIELDDSVKPTSAHSALTTIVENGKEIKILRDNMPFGRPGYGEFGTYFIGYSRSPRTIEQMLENMFVGRPPGNYDRILDFSRAVTGNLFFVPSATFLENVAEEQATDDQTNDELISGDQPAIAESPAAPAVAETSSSNSSVRDGSLRIGSLKGDIRHE